MKKKICLVILFFIILIIPNTIFAFETNLTPNEVESGKEFELILNMDENIYLCNGHLLYDKSLFEFVSCETSNIEIEEISDSDIAWFYTELQNSPHGIQQIKFKFRAASVIEDTIGNFEIQDGIYIDTDENIYENLDFIHPVKIKLKKVVMLPATGGIGILIFIIIGLALMIIAVIIKKKEDKEKEK